MKPTWYRAEGGFFDLDGTPGKFAAFWRYDLRCWTFGVRFENDPCWYSFYIDLGPIDVSLTYWRREFEHLRQI